ncbi:zinc-binding dehydrogenase [Brucella pituitosa]|uniref:zinc-binding dehydrogenase n=1 Tax=Brucella pituitosa TaxID=571256 RepID=UPI003F4A8839
MTIRVIETDKATSGGLRFATRATPEPGYGEVLIDVTHTSLNFGETRRGVRGLEADGTVLGWDASGVIVAFGPQTKAPPIGTLVVTRAPLGAWAEKRIAHVEDIAVIPEGVDPAEAATLPTAAVTALATLQLGGPILGKTVLITGASGGVGRFAIQLARLGGARVIASVGSEASAAGLTELGADLVVTSLDDVKEGIDLVIESVGGAQLVQSFKLLNRHGNVQSLGWASGEDAVFGHLGTVGPVGRHIHGFLISEYRVGSYLTALLRWLAEGKLKTEVKWRGDWNQFDQAVAALLDRRLHGKAVLDVKS